MTLQAVRAQAPLPSLVERIRFSGHPMVRSLHPTTIEITTEDHLTPRGDCIVGVAAEKGCAGLGEPLKSMLRSKMSSVEISIRAGTFEFSLRARGDPGLELSHPHDMVVRRSGFLSDRTLAVRADASAVDLPRAMVELLRDPRTRGTLEIRVT